MNTIPNILLCSLLSLFLLPFLYIFGYGASKLFIKNNNIFFSIPLGLAIYSSLSLDINYIVGFGYVQSILIIISCIVISYICGFKTKVQEKINKLDVVSIIICVLASIIVSTGVILKFHDGNYFSSIQLLDHSKISLINSINRNGLPLVNPFSLTSPSDPIAHYYFLWYLVAANVSCIFNISGWMSDVVLTQITSLASLTLIIGLIKELNVWNIKNSILCFLSVFSISIFPYIEKLSQGKIWNIKRTIHGVEAWLIQAVWVPQHLAAAIFVILTLYFLPQIKRSEFTWKHLFIFVCLITAGVGSSIWVGAITFAILSIFMFIYEQIININKNRKFLIIKWLFIASFSVICSLPILINELGATTTINRSPLCFEFWNGSTSGIFIFDILAFLFLFVTLDIPIIPLAIIISTPYIVKEKNKKSFILLIIVLGSIFVSLCLKSTIANNDLGWRSVLPAVVASTPLLIFGIEKIIKKKKVITSVVYVILILGLTQSYQYIKPMIKGEFKIQTPLSINDIKDISFLVDKKERLLVNNFNVNDGTAYMFGSSFDVNFCYFAHLYDFSFSTYFTENNTKYIDKINRIYNGEANEDDLNSLNKLDCKNILVTSDDKIYNNFMYEKYGWHLLKKNNNWKLYEKNKNFVKNSD